MLGPLLQLELTGAVAFTLMVRALRERAEEANLSITPELEARFEELGYEYTYLLFSRFLYTYFNVDYQKPLPEAIEVPVNKMSYPLDLSDLPTNKRRSEKALRMWLLHLSRILCYPSVVILYESSIVVRSEDVARKVALESIITDAVVFCLSLVLSVEYRPADLAQGLVHSYLQNRTVMTDAEMEEFILRVVPSLRREESWQILKEKVVRVGIQAQRFTEVILLHNLRSRLERLF